MERADSTGEVSQAALLSVSCNLNSCAWTRSAAGLSEIHGCVAGKFREEILHKEQYRQDRAVAETGGGITLHLCRRVRSGSRVQVREPLCRFASAFVFVLRPRAKRWLDLDHSFDHF